MDCRKAQRASLNTIYTNNKPIGETIKQFIFIGYLVFTIQNNTFEAVKENLSDAIKNLDVYF